LWNHDDENSLSRNAVFLVLNVLDQVPAVRGGARMLTAGNSILVDLAKRYGTRCNWLPDLSVKAAYVQRWLSIAAGGVAFGPTLTRIMHFGVRSAVAIADRLHRTRRAAEHPTIPDLARGIAIGPIPSCAPSTDQGDAMFQVRLASAHRG
jgi:hypothetical protein